MTCRHRFGRLTARNRVFRSIFPPTRDSIPADLRRHQALQPVEKVERVRGCDPAGSAFATSPVSFTFAGELILSC